MSYHQGDEALRLWWCCRYAPKLLLAGRQLVELFLCHSVSNDTVAPGSSQKGGRPGMFPSVKELLLSLLQGVQYKWHLRNTKLEISNEMGSSSTKEYIIYFVVCHQYSRQQHLQEGVQGRSFAGRVGVGGVAANACDTRHWEPHLAVA